MEGLACPAAGSWLIVDLDEQNAFSTHTIAPAAHAGHTPNVVNNWRGDPHGFLIESPKLGRAVGTDGPATAISAWARNILAPIKILKIHGIMQTPIDCEAPAQLRSSARQCCEVLMPYYEYLCQGCKKKFSLPLTIAEHDRGRVKCPKCGSSKLEQQWAAFYATTSKKS